MEELNLGKNNLTFIHSDTLKSLINLKTLSSTLTLSSNRITEIDPKAFQNLKELNSLYLHSNLLNELDPEIFKGLDKLETLTVYDNQTRKDSSEFVFKQLFCSQNDDENKRRYGVELKPNKPYFYLSYLIEINNKTFRNKVFRKRIFFKKLIFIRNTAERT